MPAIPIIALGAAVVGAGAAVVGTINSTKAANRANDAAQSQYSYERQLNQNKYTQSRRDAIRSARISAGATQQAGENQGASATSAAIGGLGSIQSQLNTNISFLDTQHSLADSAGAQAQIAQSARAAGAKWGAITEAGIALFNTASKYV